MAELRPSHATCHGRAPAGPSRAIRSRPRETREGRGEGGEGGEAYRGTGSSGRTRRQRFRAMRTTGRGERNVVGEKEMNRGRLWGLRAGPTCSNGGYRTASAPAGRARRAHALAARPCRVGPPRLRPKTRREGGRSRPRRGERRLGHGRLAGPRLEKGGGGNGRSRLGCGREAGPREGRGFGVFPIYFSCFSSNSSLECMIHKPSQSNNKMHDPA
jgi:hypothetical protein